MVDAGADGSVGMPVLEVTLAGALSLRRGNLRPQRSRRDEEIRKNRAHHRE